MAHSRSVFPSSCLLPSSVGVQGGGTAWVSSPTIKLITSELKKLQNLKLVLKLDLHDDKAKQKALKTVSSLPGIDMISMDMKERKLTVVGTVDPIDVVSKLRKVWRTELLSVGPAKEPEKKEEAKEEPKKEENKKEEPKKEEDKQKEESKKEVINSQDQMIMELVKAYKSYNPQMTTDYCVQSAEEDPNACVIC